MYKILAIEISLILHVLANALSENKTYAALVKEKGELFKEINEAIQESIAVLKKNNDTESVLGIEYMNQLKEQLKEINGTDITTSKNDVNSDTRRRNKITLNMAEIAAFLHSKDKNKKTQEKNILAEENKARVQKELDLWLLQKKMEKDKNVKKKRKMRIKNENCPRWGHGSSKKKKKNRHRRQDGGPAADNSSEKIKRSPKIVRYPCCRKCCKKSYMGCL